MFALCALRRYPGGTSLDPHTVGYSITRNSLSDLGMTVAYNGEANTVGVACFVASMLVMVAGAIAVLGQWVRVYVALPESRGVARAAGALGALVCGAFVGVALTPENRVMPLHGGATLLAFRNSVVQTVCTLPVDRVVLSVSALLMAGLSWCFEPQGSQRPRRTA